MHLFMIERIVEDWPSAVRWYVEVLGFREIFRDEPHQFALLEAPEGGRIALKQGKSSEQMVKNIRLVFRVDDLDAERSRLLAAGVDVSEPVANNQEHYRQAHLTDPEGLAIALFGWTC